MEDQLLRVYIRITNIEIVKVIKASGLGPDQEVLVLDHVRPDLCHEVKNLIVDALLQDTFHRN